jgi:C1A family cysteine protease
MPLPADDASSMTGTVLHRLLIAIVVAVLLTPCGAASLAAAPQSSPARWSATIDRPGDPASRTAADTGGAAASLLAAGVALTMSENEVSVSGTENTDQLRTALFASLKGLADFLGGPVDLSISIPTGNPPLTLRLQARTTTGYRWTVLPPDGESRDSSSHEVNRAPTKRGIGAPSIQTLSVEPAPGQPTTVRLRYGRSWEQASRTHATLAVTLSEATTHFDLTDPAAAVGLSTRVAPANVFTSGAGAASAGTLTSRALPSSLDWRTSGIVPDVRDQGSCGACWSFGTVGVMEAAIKKAGGPMTDLSEQFLVSCNTDGWDCDGGWTASAYHYNKLGRHQSVVGAVLETAMPYSASNGTCTVAVSHPYKLAAWKFIAGDDFTVPSVLALKTAIFNYGPVTAGVCTDAGWDSYTSGVYRPTSNGCGNSTDHQVVIVGWDDETTSWTVKNSWGADWGEAGYMRIAWDGAGTTSRIGEGASWAMMMPAAPTFTDSPLAARSSAIKAAHVTELRAAVDTLRLKYGLDPMSWSDPSLAVGITSVRAMHITELRTALGAAYVAAGLSVPVYSNATLVERSSIANAADITELRAAVLLLW